MCCEIVFRKIQPNFALIGLQRRLGKNTFVSFINWQIIDFFMCAFLDIKAVIFDCDGTLLHIEQVHYRA